jgi:peptide deformylase
MGSEINQWLSDPKALLFYPDQRLRILAQEITDFSFIPDIAKVMFELMYRHNGIGLAGPQVNLPYKIFVINLTADCQQKDKEKVFINPTIEFKKDRTTIVEEGCLSLPKLYAKVVRPKTIKVKFLDLEGKEQIFGYDGLMSRVVQHEFDHLNGVLFIDRLDEVEKLKVFSKYKV